MKTTLKINVVSISHALCASAANSVMAGAAYLWTGLLATSDPGLSETTKNRLKKIVLVAAFAANSSVDVMHFNARAIPSNIIAWHNIWLRQ